MLAGVCIGTNDLAAAGAFYDEVLAIVGFERLVTVERELGYGLPGGRSEFWVLKPFNGEPATFGNGTQVMFSLADEDGVRAFYDAVIRLGGTDEGGTWTAGLFRRLLWRLLPGFGRQQAACLPAVRGHWQRWLPVVRAGSAEFRLFPVPGDFPQISCKVHSIVAELNG